MRTRYRIDTFQQTYFVIDSFEQLIQDTAQDFDPIYARAEDGEPFPAGAVLESDRVFTRGTGEGWATHGDI